MIKNYNLFIYNNKIKDISFPNKTFKEKYKDNIFKWDKYNKEFDNVQSYYQEVFNDIFGKNWGKKFIKNEDKHIDFDEEYWDEEESDIIIRGTVFNINRIKLLFKGITKKIRNYSGRNRFRLDTVFSNKMYNAFRFDYGSHHIITGNKLGIFYITYFYNSKYIFDNSREFTIYCNDPEILINILDECGFDVKIIDYFK